MDHRCHPTTQPTTNTTSTRSIDPTMTLLPRDQVFPLLWPPGGPFCDQTTTGHLYGCTVNNEQLFSLQFIMWLQNLRVNFPLSKKGNHSGAVSLELITNHDISFSFFFFNLWLFLLGLHTAVTALCFVTFRTVLHVRPNRSVLHS